MGQKGLNLRAVPDEALKSLPSSRSRRAHQRKSRTKLAIAPALVRSEEERAIATADDGSTAFAKARKVQRTTNRETYLILNAERPLVVVRRASMLVAQNPPALFRLLHELSAFEL